ncbi:Na+/H+ antiporter NhaA [Pseudonocardia parietis]|uniref:Na(+)/H(+) antiporter NhaA n=1 Tax=Pseudonocardia parietis TaxID=570936 RepID=A0ABS4W721_9PSEU|nr:Na+/H+ antiporter NhaA [Pseudonocardia parietis]MBP2371913.1 NhaA family Na+:H+ antiporter [Pseudonocardia parietis]
MRSEPLGGVLLLVATVSALLWANSPFADSYFAVRDTAFGPAALHLDLSIGQWASDALLAVFFFVIGLELKREFVTGDLRDPRRALVPIAAAVGGVVVPAAFYVLVVLSSGAPDALSGWAVPTATDIAFALAVLAVVGRGLPPAVRTFLLTLAVVDDLIAITIIAVGYTAGVVVLPLLAAAVPLAAFAVVTRRGFTAWWVLVPLALLTWGLVHASGVHATVAGVLLGLVVPAREVAPRLEHLLQPFSSLVAVPVFALFAAGVAIGGLSGLLSALTSPIGLAVAGGLVIGKTLGVFGAAFLATRLPGVRLDGSMRWSDVAALAPLSGVGFTVALLIGELAFGGSTLADDHVKIGVLAGSLLAALLGAILLWLRARSNKADSLPTATQAPTTKGRGR